MKIQRLRVTFTRGDEMKYVTHLDMMRFWERALRRAGVPVFYSEGFSPHPQIALAAPLAVGTTSDCELLDVFLEQRLTPRAFIDALSPQLPPAATIVSAQEAGLTLPSLQADIRAAEYEVDAPVPDGFDVDAAVRCLLDAESIPWQHKRDEEMKSYDLRPLVHEIEILRRAQPGAAAIPASRATTQDADAGTASVRLRMLLCNNSTNGAGRPEQVALALGLALPTRIHRTRLMLADRSPARDAIRKQGRYAV
jgi:radical SAM-linked protein